MKRTGGVATSDAIARLRRSSKLMVFSIESRILRTGATDFYPPSGGDTARTPTGGVSSGAVRRKLRDRCANFRALNQEITRDQCEARSPHTVELANHLHRSPAADGVRRPVDR